MNFELRDYQKEALEKMVQFEQVPNKKNGLIIMATGVGKTEVFIAYIYRAYLENPSFRVLVLERSVDLVRQTAQRIRDRSPQLTCQECYDGIIPETNYERMPVVTIGTAQTIKRFVSSEDISKNTFDKIIIDECHHENTTTTELKTICYYFNYQHCFGFTATPKESPLFSIDDVVYHYPILRAQKEGHLISANDIHYKTLKAYNPLQEQFANFETAINKICIEGHNRFCLWYCADTAQAYILERIMAKLGVRCGVIIGETDKITREAHLQQFKQDPYFNLINVNVFNEGMDVPEIETIVLAKTVASDHLAKQILGRGLRKCVGKRGLYIYDLCVNQNIYSKLYRDIALSPLELLFESKNFSRNNQYDNTKKKKILQYLQEIPDELLSTLQSNLKIFEFKDNFIIPELSDFKFVYEGNIGYLAGKIGRADIDFLFAVEQTSKDFVCYEGNTSFRKNSAEEVADYLRKKIEKYFVKFITYKDEKGVRAGARSEPTDGQISLLCSLCGLPNNEDIILGLKTLYTKYSIGIEIDSYLAPKKCKPMVERIKSTMTKTVKSSAKALVSLKDQRKPKTKTLAPRDDDKSEATKVHQNEERLPTIYVENKESALARAAKKVKGRVSKIKKAIDDHTEYCGVFWRYKEYL